MKSFQAEAAAWAAPLFALLGTVNAAGKQTHKLPPMPCVLWLPDYRAYLRSLDLLHASFKTCPNVDGAMRLAEDQAAALAQDLIDLTAVRVELRAFHYASSLGGSHVAQ
ncbi:MAG: hypothetical protein GXC94_20095 [Comamonadaceae bacterium]|nr:hypothetical protein [Comamonadaceae bacterium]